MAGRQNVHLREVFTFSRCLTTMVHLEFVYFGYAFANVLLLVGFTVSTGGTILGNRMFTTNCISCAENQ